MSERLLVGVITGAHGVKGLVRVKSFMQDPAALCAYGPLADEAGARWFRLALKNQAGEALVCAVDGVGDRTAAEKLKGVRLTLDRAALPDDALEDDEFYHADLIGLPVELVGGERLGVLRAVVDYGAGDLLDVERTNAEGAQGKGGVRKGSVLIPFTRACVPVVDLEAGRIVVDPPPGLLDEPTPKKRGSASAPDPDEGDAS